MMKLIHRLLRERWIWSIVEGACMGTVTVIVIASLLTPCYAAMY